MRSRRSALTDPHRSAARAIVAPGPCSRLNLSAARRRQDDDRAGHTAALNLGLVRPLPELFRGLLFVRPHLANRPVSTANSSTVAPPAVLYDLTIKPVVPPGTSFMLSSAARASMTWCMRCQRLSRGLTR